MSKSLVADANLTRTGAFMGTPLFAAPEQVRGAAVDERTDIYAVGATLFYLLAGRGPFDGDAMSVVAQIVSDPPESLRKLRDDVPTALDRIIIRTLEKDPARRFQSLSDLRNALRPYATGGTSMADLGRRLAAYALDTLVAQVLGFIALATFGLVVTLVNLARGTLEPAAPAGQTTVQAVLQLVQAVVGLSYFTVAEGIWGRGLGKLATGLRLTNMQGERPGIGRTALRSFCLPGALGVTFVLPLLMASGASEFLQRYGMLAGAGLGALTVAVNLAMLLTMRATNGYRGIHDLVSGTRVIRWATSVARGEVDVPAVLPEAVTTPEQFGPYQTIGQLGTSGAARVLLARDAVLHRSVWVRIGDAADGESRDAPAEVRPTRPHFLQAGTTEDGRRWEAYEAVTGAPLTELVRQTGPFPWETGRHLLLDLASELAAAERDGAVPVDLTLDHIWIDRGGRLKLLDQRLQWLPPPQQTTEQSPRQTVETAASGADERHDATPTAPGSAVQLLKQAAPLLTQVQYPPPKLSEFLSELDQREDSPDTIAWACERLSDLGSHRVRLKWDDRLGMLAASAGTEIVMLLTIVVFGTALVWTLPLPDSARYFLPLGLATIGILAAGYWFRGGVVFWFTGVDVRRASDGGPAGPLRCAWRNLLVWFPFACFYAVITAATMQIMIQEGADATTDPEAFNRAIFSHLPGVCGSECMMLFFVFGIFYTLIRPQRGLQDILTGTYLVPRR